MRFLVAVAFSVDLIAPVVKLVNVKYSQSEMVTFADCGTWHDFRYFLWARDGKAKTVLSAFGFTGNRL